MNDLYLKQFHLLQEFCQDACWLIFGNQSNLGSSYSSSMEDYLWISPLSVSFFPSLLFGNAYNMGLGNWSNFSQAWPHRGQDVIWPGRWLWSERVGLRRPAVATPISEGPSFPVEQAYSYEGVSCLQSKSGIGGVHFHTLQLHSIPPFSCAPQAQGSGYFVLCWSLSVSCA